MNFLQAMRFLKSISKAKMPIKVKRVHLKNLDGLCEKKKDHFLIKINNTISEQHAIDVLIHEISHADADIWDKEKMHGESWACCYAQLYQQWEKHLDQNEF